MSAHKEPIFFLHSFKVKSKSTHNTTIAKSAGTVGLAVMFSRILGLVREQVFAALFGAGTANDAFVVAFRIPNLLRDLFGEGALSAAFVRVFTEYDTHKSQKQTWQLASTVLVFFGCLLSILTIAAIVFSDQLVGVFVKDYSLVEGKMELTVLLTRIMMPFLIFISLAAVVMGVLNTKGKFFVPAIASSFFNLGSIIGGASLALYLPRFDIPAIVGMAIGTLIGGIMQLSIQLPSLFRVGFKFTSQINFLDPGLLKILKLMIPAVIGLSATQINIFINTSFAASCPEGSVSWLQYSFRMVQLPIGVFGVAVGIAAMPLLSRHSANKDIEGLKETFASSMVMVFCLTIPAAAGLFILSEPIIRLIFERGAFTPVDTIATAQALALYSIGLFAYSSNKVLVPVFYALEKTRYPVIASFLAIFTNIVLIYFTIDYFQHLAIALSMSITMLINFLFLNLILYRQVGGFNLKHLLSSFLKIIFATLAMSIFLLFSKQIATPLLEGTLVQNLVAVVAIISAAVVIYSITIHILKLDEFTFIVEKMKGKFLKA